MLDKSPARDIYDFFIISPRRHEDTKKKEVKRLRG
jgi:hypothetical protein